MAAKWDKLCYQIANLPHVSIPTTQQFFALVQNATREIPAFSKPDVSVKEPKLSQWDYLDQEKVETLLNLKNEEDINNFIGSTLKNYPKGIAKNLLIQLISDVTKFCQNQDFDVEKTGTILSQFYLTHVYFTSGLEISSEKIYVYFKDLMMCHSLPFPPSKKKVFTLREARCILDFFGKVYLRNLPLIKYLCKPNFALFLNYEIPPPPILQMKDKKEKKGKGKGGKKGKNK